ncbi:MAG: TAXI family TRAP transporter solute-binding subunit [Candidatus Rokubacteria bacterium]|nr:TAXI family TRAP transporter solute-binding subunit [Candidatus Rokubacteria bacterium]MBI2490497.1 TAXI family TRAP transporter solute-binding subunit [Candidatus Rokubacteria bacterium]
MRNLKFVTAIALAALGVAALATPAAAQKVSVVFSAGPTGGTWTPMAGATAEVIKKKFPELDVQVEPGAALVNMEKIRNDKADLGWSMTNVLSDALTGTGQWSGKKTDRPMVVATYYPNVWQLVVPASSDIKSMRDLKGKPVSLPARGNTSLADGWEVLLKVNDMKLEDLGPKSYGPVSSNSEAVKNRQAMASGWFTVVPASFVLDLGSTMKLRMIPVSDAEFAKIQKVNPGFVRHVIKAGTYAEQGITDDVRTFQSPTILIASAKTSADVIYKVTKAIVEGRADFTHVNKVMAGVTAKDMAQDYGMPFHPGAAKYFKEIGVLK